MVACLLGIASIAASCSVVKHEKVATATMLQSLTGLGGRAGPTNLLELAQSGVMREADLYVGAVAEATDGLRARVTTTEARNLMQQWKLQEATAAYVNATGENPILNAVDMLVLASLSRFVAEDYWVGEKFGAAAQPLLETHRQLETNAWKVVRLVLTPGQEEEIRKLLREYREKYPHLRYVAAARMPELAGALGKIPFEEQKQKPNSVFNLLYLNPLAGLDPTTEAIQQTRILAQRAMYYAQRAPMLLGWQVELTTYQLASQPETRQVLSDVGDVSKSAKIFAQTAEGLPKLVNDQREAAINQLLAGIATERTNILATLNAQETQLRDLLPQVQKTLTAGGDMATALNAAIQSLDAFVHYVSPPDTNSPPTSPGTNSPPFNILDYGTAASQIGAAADKLNTAIVSLNQGLPEITKLSQQAAVDGKAVVNHAFRLGLVLVVVLGIVAVLAVLTCRRLGGRGAN